MGQFGAATASYGVDMLKSTQVGVWLPDGACGGLACAQKAACVFGRALRTESLLGVGIGGVWDMGQRKRQRWRGEGACFKSVRESGEGWGGGGRGGLQVNQG